MQGALLRTSAQHRFHTTAARRKAVQATSTPQPVMLQVWDVCHGLYQPCTCTKAGKTCSSSARR